MKKTCPNLPFMGFIIATVILVVIPALTYVKQKALDTVIPGPGVTRTGSLSDYLPALKGSSADTPVYYLEGKESGGTVLLVGERIRTNPQVSSRLCSSSKEGRCKRGE